MIPTEWRYLISPIWTIVNKVCNKKDLEKYEEKLSKCPNYEKINEFSSKLVEKIKNTEVCVDKDLFLKIREYAHDIDYHEPSKSKAKKRTTRKLTDEERSENGDVL